MGSSPTIRCSCGTRHLMKAGFSLTVHNRSRAPVDELVREGARDGRSSRAVAEESDIIITMLPDSPDVQQVVAGPSGVLEGIRGGAVLVDMSTISPIVTQELANAVRAKGAEMLDAPVSGGEKGAIEATLSIMVGGPAAAFARVKPVFEAMGKNIVHIGDSGAGQVTKACNQVVVALTIQAVSEALALAAKAGVDPAKVRQALLGGFAQSRILDVHGLRMLERNFKPGFRVRLHQKDLNIALSTGTSLGVPLPATAVVQEAFTALQGLGRGEQDHSSLVTLIEDLAKTEVKSHKI
ncbi:MAG: 2-hydroxy-3-oxopropionate reductase [Armatimonadetes bacterium]|nr:2-hydroxy-3-oxopropionate reductase [Armatimonadota bacterium]